MLCCKFKGGAYARFVQQTTSAQQQQQGPADSTGAQTVTRVVQTPAGEATRTITTHGNAAITPEDEKGLCMCVCVCVVLHCIILVIC